ncbi:MAG: ribosome biogenesis factor YjgA [Gammaproteobacteria bacterium]|jgi:ribosome-associated protein
MQDESSYERKSKSQLKREAHALQELGERLLTLNEETLAALPLPDELRQALAEGRQIRARGALRRQRQYIGKLMRGIDPEPIRAALAKRRHGD